MGFQFEIPKPFECNQQKLPSLYTVVRLALTNPDYLAIMVDFLQTMRKLDPKPMVTQVPIVWRRDSKRLHVHPTLGEDVMGQKLKASEALDQMILIQAMPPDIRLHMNLILGEAYMTLASCMPMSSHLGKCSLMRAMELLWISHGCCFWIRSPKNVHIFEEPIEAEVLTERGFSYQ